MNPRNYRNFRRGDIIVSLAGVFTNLLVAIGCVVLVVITGVLAGLIPGLAPSFAIIQAMMRIGITLNMVLIGFNLIPIPPLDGSHVVKYLMPPSWAFAYVKFQRYGILVLVALLYFAPGILNAWLGPAFRVGDFMVASVNRFLLPSAEQWLR